MRSLSEHYPPVERRQTAQQASQERFVHGFVPPQLSWATEYSGHEDSVVTRSHPRCGQALSGLQPTDERKLLGSLGRYGGHTGASNRGEWVLCVSSCSIARGLQNRAGSIFLCTGERQRTPGQGRGLAAPSGSLGLRSPGFSGGFAAPAMNAATPRALDMAVY
jgi:hypothetical protein